MVVYWLCKQKPHPSLHPSHTQAASPGRGTTSNTSTQTTLSRDALIWFFTLLEKVRGVSLFGFRGYRGSAGLELHLGKVLLRYTWINSGTKSLSLPWLYWLLQEPQRWEHRAGESGSCKKAELPQGTYSDTLLFFFYQIFPVEATLPFSFLCAWISQAELSF